MAQEVAKACLPPAKIPKPDYSVDDEELGIFDYPWQSEAEILDAEAQSSADHLELAHEAEIHARRLADYGRRLIRKSDIPTFENHLNRALAMIHERLPAATSPWGAKGSRARGRWYRRIHGILPTHIDGLAIEQAGELLWDLGHELQLDSSEAPSIARLLRT